MLAGPATVFAFSMCAYSTGEQGPCKACWLSTVAEMLDKERAKASHSGQLEWWRAQGARESIGLPFDVFSEERYGLTLELSKTHIKLQMRRKFRNQQCVQAPPAPTMKLHPSIVIIISQIDSSYFLY